MAYSESYTSKANNSTNDYTVSAGTASPFDALNASTAAAVASLLAAIAARSNGNGLLATEDPGQIIYPTPLPSAGGIHPVQGTTVTAALAPVRGSALYVDGSMGVDTLIGTAGFNVVGTAGASGTGEIVVDLNHGLVMRGSQLDATLANVQGVQLGQAPSLVLGLGAGNDVIYGGSGTANVFGGGANDVFKGGTGTNVFVGSTGNEVFYSGNGTDVMVGGSAQNFMQGGSAPDSTATFFGRGGSDFVYGEGGSITLQAGTGVETLHGGSGVNTLIGSNERDGQGHAGTTIFYGGTGAQAGTDIDYAGIGVNLLFEGSGTDIFAGSSGTDYIYGGAGRSFVYGGSGTDVITTGAGNQYVQAGSGLTFFNDTAANLHAGRFDQIDHFGAGKGTNLYLPTAVQGATSFLAQNGGTAIITTVGSGTAEVFVSETSVTAVQAHTHFTL